MKDFLKHIDPHVHCRDWAESYKATIRSVTDLARSQDVCAIFDMPNTIPPIISKNLVEKRIETAKLEGCLEGYYLWIGITKDPVQIKEAVDVVWANPFVVGIKMFAGKSVGDLAIIDECTQMKVYQELTKAGYDGVLAVHCEKESLTRMHLWNPNDPQSWNRARPPSSEVESVKDQITFAKKYDFKGVLHICHVSVPETVQVIREESELKITCGVTPHHLIYSSQDMFGDNGLLYKVNPPLREHSSTQLLKDLLRQGKIDWIETDTAPHTENEKLNPPYMSGIQSLKTYSLLLRDLVKEGISQDQISRLTYENIKKVFKKINQ